MRVTTDNSVVLDEADIREFCSRWPTPLRGLRGLRVWFDSDFGMSMLQPKTGRSYDWDGKALASLIAEASMYLETFNKRIASR